MEINELEDEHVIVVEFVNEGHSSIITVLPDSGFISFAGYNGNYSYKWNSFGDNFFKFLSNLNYDYVMSKFTNGNYMAFNHVVAIKQYREYVLDSRREGYLEKDDARDIWDDIRSLESELDDYTISSKDVFYSLFNQYHSFYDNIDVPCNLGVVECVKHRRFYDMIFKPATQYFLNN